MMTSVIYKLTLMAALTGNGLALTPVKEEFETSRIDLVRWFYHREPKARLIPTDGVLSFRVTSKPLAANFASIELIASQPGLNEDWEMTLEATNKSSFVRTAACGISIFNAADRNDRLYLNFYGEAGIGTGAYTDNVNAHAPKLSTGAGRATGGVRISFSKKTKLLTIFLSDTLSSEGYEWLKIGSFSPTGRGGDVRADWKMDPVSGGFGIQLFGNVGAKAIPTGKIAFDNFVLSTPL